MSRQVSYDHDWIKEFNNLTAFKLHVPLECFKSFFHDFSELIIYDTVASKQQIFHV